MKEKLTIDEVAALAQVSVPTIYRRVKLGDFPKPRKVPTTATRGPKNVNRWERTEVMGWLMKGNDPRWMAQPIHKIEAVAKSLEDDIVGLAKAARGDKDAFAVYDAEQEREENKKSLMNDFTFMAIIGGSLAAVAWAMFGG